MTRDPASIVAALAPSPDERPRTAANLRIDQLIVLLDAGLPPAAERLARTLATRLRRPDEMSLAAAAAFVARHRGER